MQPNKHSKPKDELSQKAVHLVGACYWTINMPTFKADSAVFGQNEGKKDNRQFVTECSYCFSFVEYIAVKKECVKWTTVVNAKIEIKGWPGLNRVCQYCTLFHSYLGMYLKKQQQNKAETKKTNKQTKTRQREKRRGA